MRNQRRWDEWLHGMRKYVRKTRVRQSFNYDATTVELKLKNGQWVTYTLTGLEALQDFEGWLEVIERDIITRCSTHSETWNNWLGIDVGGIDRTTYSWWRTGEVINSAQLNAGIDALSVEQTWNDMPYYVTYVDRAQFYGSFVWGSDETPEDIAKRAEADKKAADLFKMACGQEAFDTLESGKPLPLTGSKGTAYLLRKQAAYCITRVSDNARLCAVVPSVPLWDHLLGIKLMVEHDEDRFLETANVAQDMTAMFSETMRNHAAQLADNIVANNALLDRLRRRDYAVRITDTAA